MGYSTSAPPALISQQIDNNLVPKIWVYSNTDTPATVAGSGYFSDGKTRGMAVGDLVFYIDTTLNSVTEFVVSALNATTNSATVAAAGGEPLDNLAATTDPVAGSDNTLGYGVGSIWVNTTNGRVWIAQSVATGAAAWALAVVPGTGIEPSTNLEQIGSGTLTTIAEGNVYRMVSGTGVNPGATGADNVLASFSIPANTFDGTGNRGLSFQANGSFANNTNSKRVKIIFNPASATVGSTVGAGGTTIIDTGAYTTAALTGFMVTAEVFKYGAANSNTQLGIPTGIILAATHGGVGAGAAGTPAAITATENAAILVAVTGNAATTATDISLNFFAINAMN